MGIIEWLLEKVIEFFVELIGNGLIKWIFKTKTRKIVALIIFIIVLCIFMYSCTSQIIEIRKANGL